MYNATKSFLDLKKEQLNQLSTIKLAGIPIEPLNNGQANRDRLFAIEVGCLCLNVQDSPHDPCPCKNRPPIIVWLPEDGCIRYYKSDKPNHDGRELTVFEMSKDATIYIERMQSIKLSSISRLNTIAKNYKTQANGNGSGGGPITNPGSSATALIPVWWHVAEAFHLGVFIGETLDHGGHLSDWLAGVDNSPHYEPVP